MYTSIDMTAMYNIYIYIYIYIYVYVNIQHTQYVKNTLAYIK